MSTGALNNIWIRWKISFKWPQINLSSSYTPSYAHFQRTLDGKSYDIEIKVFPLCFLSQSHSMLLGESSLISSLHIMYTYKTKFPPF